MGLIEQIGAMVRPALAAGGPHSRGRGASVPRNTASWFYVFGSAALTVFLLQLVTGILLALIYVSSAGEVWRSLQSLNHDITLGWFIRAMHGWGSNFMIAIVLIHMVQVFLFGAYKFPRELTWIVGVFLLLMTLGMAFSGQVAFRSGRLLGTGNWRFDRKSCAHCGPADSEVARRAGRLLPEQHCPDFLL